MKVLTKHGAISAIKLKRVNFYSDSKRDSTYAKNIKQEENLLTSQKNKENANEKNNKSSYIPCSDYESLQVKDSHRMPLSERKKIHRNKINNLIKIHNIKIKENDILMRNFSHMVGHVFAPIKNKINFQKTEKINELDDLPHISPNFYSLCDNWHITIKNAGAFICTNSFNLRTKTHVVGKEIEEAVLKEANNLQTGNSLLYGTYNINKYVCPDDNINKVEIEIETETKQIFVYNSNLERIPLEYHKATYFFKHLIPVRLLGLKKEEIYLCCNYSNASALLGRGVLIKRKKLKALNLFADEQEPMINRGFINDTALQKKFAFFSHNTNQIVSHERMLIPVLHDYSLEAMQKICELCKIHNKETGYKMLIDISKIAINEAYVEELHIRRKNNIDHLATINKELSKKIKKVNKAYENNDINSIRDLAYQTAYKLALSKNKGDFDFDSFIKDKEVAELIFLRLRKEIEWEKETNDDLNKKLNNFIKIIEKEIDDTNKNIEKMVNAIVMLRTMDAPIITGVSILGAYSITQIPIVAEILYQDIRDKNQTTSLAQKTTAIAKIIRRAASRKVDEYYQGTEDVIQTIIKIIGKENTFPIIYRTLEYGKEKLSIGMLGILQIIIRDVLNRYERSENGYIPERKLAGELINDIAHKLSINIKQAAEVMWTTPVREAFNGLLSIICQETVELYPQECLEWLKKNKDKHGVADDEEVTMSKEEVCF